MFADRHNDLSMEAQRLSAEASAAARKQDKQRSNDALTAVGIVVFRPSLLFIKADNAATERLSRLRGEMEAVEAASIRQRCQIQFQRDE
jgi:hypothetical protein